MTMKMMFFLVETRSEAPTTQEFTVPGLQTVHQSIEVWRQYFQAEGKPEDLQQVDQLYETIQQHSIAKKRQSSLLDYFDAYVCTTHE